MGYIENIKSIMQWGNSFERQGDFPLDRTDLHSSYVDALLYAKGDGSDSRQLGKLAYIGQIITVWGPNENNEDGVWVYSLVPSKEEGTLATLQNISEVDLSNYVTRGEIGSIFNYKGSVSSFLNLPQENVKNGDVYNIENTFTIGELDNAKTYPAGTNVVYTDNGWDTLGGSVDLSSYATKGDLSTEVEKLNESITTKYGTLSSLIDGKVSIDGDKTLISPVELAAIASNTSRITQLENKFQGTGNDGTTINLGDLINQVEANSAALTTKADKSELENKADASALEAVRAQLGGISSDVTSNTNSIATVTGLVSALDSRVTSVEGLRTSVSELATQVSTNLQIAKEYTNTSIGTYSGEGVTASGLRGEIEVKNAQVLASVEGVQTNLTNHIKDITLHVTADERANWNAAKAAIDTFLKDADMTTDAVDTLKELQSYMTSDGAAATGLLNRVSALESSKDAYKDADATTLASAKEYVDTKVGNLGTMSVKSADDYYTKSDINAMWEWQTVD